MTNWFPRAAALAAVCGLATAASAQSERGLARFGAPAAPRADAIPECIKAPVAGAPEWSGPIGVFALPEEMALACFDPVNPPSWEVQQIVNQVMITFMNDRFNIQGSWAGADNAPITLTWSFVPDGTSIPASGNGDVAANSNLFAQMDAKFGGIGNRATWIAQFQACFNRWAALTGVSYTRVQSGANAWDDGAAFPGTAGAAGARGDLRIGMKNIDGVNGILAYNYFPSTGDMVLDSSENWAQGAPNYTFLFNTLTHEHGHGLGLLHVCPSNGTKLMEPFLNTGFTGPQQDDIRGAQFNYGDDYESNNTIGTATSLGSISVGSVANPSVVPAPAVSSGSITSIGIDGDEDFYSVNAAVPILGTVTVTPVGSNYADYPQDASCNNTVANTNSLNQADLAFDIVNSAGTVLYTQSAGGFGATETLSNILFSPAGNLFVKVREVNAPTETQLYTLSVSGVSIPTMAASDSTFADRVRVTWSAVPNITTFTVFRGTTNVRASAASVGTAGAGAVQFDDLTAVPGTTYFYWLEGTSIAGSGSRPIAGPDQGTRQGSAAPANDVCASAIDTSAGGVFNGTLVAATNDGTASCGTSATNPDVWYSFTAPACAGVLTASTCGTNDTGGVNLGIDTVLSLHATCGGTELACNDDSVGECGATDTSSIRDSFITRALAAGETVKIRVSKFGASSVGPFILNVSFAIPNDTCANASVITAGAPVAFCNIGALTDGPTEAACNFFSNNNITGDLWYSYTPAASGRYNVRTCGSAFDTKLGVYASVCPAGPDTVLACNDDSAVCGTGSLQSTVSVIGVAGQVNRIRVGGYNGATGNGQIQVFCAADYNQSGAVSVQDIFDFLADYFGNAAGADFNGVGGLSVQDIFDFLAAYFTGC